MTNLQLIAGVAFAFVIDTTRNRHLFLIFLILNKLHSFSFSVT